MKKIIIITSLFFIIFLETSSYSYGGPQVNDRNVVPVFVPKFYQANFLQIPADININTAILNDIIFHKNDVNISEKLINSYAWRKLERGKIINLKEINQNIKNINNLSGIKASAELKKI
ncbi:MAG: hypothetical protein FF85_04825 [alpha proteobacterium QL1]|jgi:hypothetical protein|nr:MAG: hypothetical protein FF85_04825 [alpha proteobacterium QL1]